MAEAKPPTNAAGQTPAPLDPLAGLLNANSGAPPLFPRTPKTTSLLPNVTNARLYTCSRYPPAPQQEMRAIDPRDEERRRRQANNLGIMFLGPVFGAPAALGRLAGAPENVVENLGQLGLDAASVVGVPGARGARRVIEPVPVKPVPTRVVRVTPVETGVFVLKRKTHLDWNAVIPKKGKYKGESREDHVRRHNQNDLSKETHGVFNDDGVKITNEAWSRAQDLNLTPNADGELIVPMGRVVGIQGGSMGSGAALSNVRIILTPGTPNIITSMPY